MRSACDDVCALRCKYRSIRAPVAPGGTRIWHEFFESVVLVVGRMVPPYLLGSRGRTRASWAERIRCCLRGLWAAVLRILVELGKWPSMLQGADACLAGARDRMSTGCN